MIGLWIILLTFGVAIVKPWGAGELQAAVRPIALRPTTIPATPVPTEDRTADGLAETICLGAGVWQVASLETWRSQDVRVWRAIDPIVGARGPSDPAIPTVPIVALAVDGLGWCAPTYGPGRPEGPATVSAWYVRAGLVSEVTLRQLRPDDGVTPLGALYVPLTTCPEPTICAPLLQVPVSGSWTSGRVVFRYRDGLAGGTVWFAAELAIDPSPSDPPSGPSTKPGS